MRIGDAITATRVEVGVFNSFHLDSNVLINLNCFNHNADTNI